MIRPYTPAQEILAEAGILKPAKPLATVEQSKIQELLDSAGAGVVDAANALAIGLADPKSRLSASRLIFQLHGALTEADKPTAPIIQINIQTKDDSKTLLQFITPSNENLPLAEDEL